MYEVMTYPTLQFFVFKTMAVRHLGLLKFTFFYPTGSGRPVCISIPNFDADSRPLLALIDRIPFLVYYKTSAGKYLLRSDTVCPCQSSMYFSKNGLIIRAIMSDSTLETVAFLTCNNI